MIKKRTLPDDLLIYLGYLKKNLRAQIIDDILPQLPATIINQYNTGDATVYGNIEKDLYYPEQQQQSQPQQQQQQPEEKEQQHEQQQQQQRKAKRPSDPVEGPSQKRQQVDDESNDDSGTDYDVFLDNKNMLKLRKKSKTYIYLHPHQYKTSPNKPRIDADDITTLNKFVDIVLSEHHAFQASSIANQIYQVNMGEQDSNSCLDDFPGTKMFLKSVLEEKMDDFPKFMWMNGYEGCTEEELEMNKMMRYILTDFHLNCMIKAGDKTTNERTPFCEHFIPIFKAFSGVTRLMDFVWCEKGLMNNRLLSLCLPKPMNFRSLLDGIGTSLKDKVERLLIESSGNDDGHTEEDTLKQISNTINSLGVDLRNYKLASYDTFLKRQIFGIHFIDEKMTLTSTCLVTPARYAFIEVRSARIPTSYEERWDWAKVIELLLKLKRDLMDQEGVTELLKQEQNGFVKVARTVKDTVKGDVKKAMTDAM